MVVWDGLDNDAARSQQSRLVEIYAIERMSQDLARGGIIQFSEIVILG